MHGYKSTWILLGLSLCSIAEAHRPIFSEQKAVTAEDAVIIADPCVSQVIYREITEKTPQLWLGFDVEADFELFVQIGVPALERLKDFRPCFLVVGPGLPDTESKIRLPTGVGAKSFCTDKVEKPRFFHEHFTGTDSRILRSETVTLPEKGRYYVAAYDPDESGGKLWLSVGKREVFSVADMGLFPAWKQKIRTFHEVQDQKHGIGTELLKTFLGLSAAPGAPNSKNTVVNLIESETDLSVLYSALKAADLVRTLSGDGPFTVFAPTNKALSAVSGLEELVKPENSDRLKALLKAHVIGERIYLQGRRIESLSGKQALIQSNGPILVDDALVLKANIAADNGLVHIIDRVIGSDTAAGPIRRMIETVIGYGVPLYNAGQFEACASAYRTALLNIEEFSGEEVSRAMRDSIRAAIEKAGNEKDQSRQAWTLRYALDEIYRQLDPRAKGETISQADLLIDDFSNNNLVAAIGTRWRLVTDRVMGGVSDADLQYGKDERFDHVCLKGNVSLENNGGFIQIALALDPSGGSFDASGYRGIRLWVKGNKRDYYVHLRTKETLLPWQYYSASFEAPAEWAKVELDFDEFKPQSLGGKLNVGGLSRIAVVAAKQAFEAEVCVARIEFYK